MKLGIGGAAGGLNVQAGLIVLSYSGQQKQGGFFAFHWTTQITFTW